MKEKGSVLGSGSNRRSFLRNATVAAGAATMGAALLPTGLRAFDDDGDRAPITKGDIAILKFLQALEQVEEDLWRQYAELGGIQTTEFAGFSTGNGPYIGSLLKLDGDMPQYINDNTDDEISHARFLGKYLDLKLGVINMDQNTYSKLKNGSNG